MSHRLLDTAYVSGTSDSLLTAAVTPLSNKLLLLACVFEEAGFIEPSCAGGGLTWTYRGVQTTNSTNQTIAFTAPTGTSPTEFQAAIDFKETVGSRVYVLVEFDVDASIAPVQVVSDKSGGPANTLSTVLSAFANASNVTAMIGSTYGNNTLTPETSNGYTLLGSSGGTVGRIMIAAKDGEDTSPSFTSTSSLRELAIFAFELAIVSGGGGGGNGFYYSRRRRDA